MTTVVQTTYPQPAGYLQPGYPAQQATFIQVPQSQTTTATATTSVTPGVSPRYNKKAGLITGILQIIAGAVLIILGIVLLALGSWLSIGWNIWGGICFYIITGILGVVSKNQSRCVIIAYMVMCIIAAICAGSQMTYASIAAAVSTHMESDYCGYYYSYSTSCSRQKSIVAMHSLSALAAFCEMIIAIVGSAYCCSGVCGSSTPAQTTMVTYAQPAPNGHVTVFSPSSYPAPGPAHPGPQPGMYQQPPAYSQMQAGMQPNQFSQMHAGMQPNQFPQQPVTYEVPK